MTTAADPRLACPLPPSGWRCTRMNGHDGPCAAVPDRDIEPDNEPLSICPPWRTPEDHAELTALRAEHARLVEAVRAMLATLPRCQTAVRLAGPHPPAFFTTKLFGMSWENWGYPDVPPIGWAPCGEPVVRLSDEPYTDDRCEDHATPDMNGAPWADHMRSLVSMVDAATLAALCEGADRG